MNNKGFTLIELIATILLLSVISVISFVSISGVIKNSRNNDCVALLNGIKNAANEYVSDNRYNKDFINGITDNKISIDASVLIDKKYLTSPIVNPYTKEEMDTEHILIEILLNDEYTVEDVLVFGVTCNK